MVEYTMDLVLVTWIHVPMMPFLMGNLYKSISDEMVTCRNKDDPINGGTSEMFLLIVIE